SANAALQYDLCCYSTAGICLRHRIAETAMEIAEMKPAQCKESGRSDKIKPEMLAKKIKCQCGAVVRIPDETGAVPRGSADANDIEAVQKLQKAYEAIRAELSKVIVGQSDVIEELLI